MSTAGNAPTRAATPGTRSIDWRKLAIHSEWLFAAVATAIIVYRHWVNLRGAGGLWRDEAHTAELARLPAWQDIVGNLRWDSFPLLSTAVLRAWCWLPEGGSDDGLRLYGFCVGLLILAGFWWIAHRVHGGPPTIALLLWGLSPLAVRFGDSVRPHGLGFLWITLAWATLANIALGAPPSASAALPAKPSAAISNLRRWSIWIFAVVVAVGAVQTIYTNALLLGGFIAAAVLVALIERRALQLIPLLAVGAVAALSLLPYVTSIQAAGQWAPITNAQDPSVSEDWRRLVNVLNAPGRLFTVIWFLLPLTLVAVTIWTWTWGRQLASWQRRPGTLFACVALGLGWTLYFGLIARTTFVTQPWHFLPLLLLPALAADQILGGWRALAVARSGLLLLGVFLTGALSQRYLRERNTNVDLAAARVAAEATPADLVLVQPWYDGVTFHRYYHGAAPWMTIPPMEIINLHRYDLVQRQFALSNPTAPVRERIAATLSSGGRVWMVGNLPRWMSTAAPPPVSGPDADQTLTYGNRWNLMAYEVGYYLQRHELRRRAILLKDDQPVMMEEVELGVAEGWRP